MHPGNFLKNPDSRRDSFLVNHCGDVQGKQPVSLISSLAKIQKLESERRHHGGWQAGSNLKWKVEITIGGLGAQVQNTSVDYQGVIISPVLLVACYCI